MSYETDPNQAKYELLIADPDWLARHWLQYIAIIDEEVVAIGPDEDAVYAEAQAAIGSSDVRKALFYSRVYAQQVMQLPTVLEMGKSD